VAEAVFVGEWVLAPELCLYNVGEPPRSGVYRIAPGGHGGFDINIEWEAADGSRHSVSFGGPADGRAIPSEAPGVSHITLTQIDAHTLDSAAFQSDQMLSYARRRAAADGSLLVTVQEAPAPDGGRMRNFQVYRRR